MGGVGSGVSLGGGGGGGEEGAALDAGGWGLEDAGGGGDEDTAGADGKTSSCAGTRVVTVTPTCATLATDVVSPSVVVASGLIGPTIGSQAPLPIGPPSCAVTVGRVFR
jgi:hypothetical protein